MGRRNITLSQHAIEGWVAPGLESVAAVFAENFTQHGDVGASFAVMQRGKMLVDLWGGMARPEVGQAWERDTLQLVFSGTKGLVAAAMVILIDRGQLALSAPVSRYWPEFGKGEILIRDILSHEGRLPGIETPLDMLAITDDRRMAALLARQLPSSDPRAATCYHPLTYGWLCGEVIRRVSGRSVGQFVAEEIVAPLQLECWIGLPEALEPRVSSLVMAPDWGISEFMDPATWAYDPLIQSIWGNPPHFSRNTFPWNDPAFHQAEVPGVNAITTARSLAKFYNCLANGGAPIMSPQAAVLASQPSSSWVDAVHGGRRRMGAGFELQNELLPYGPARGAFGHTGAGGSNHGAWPEFGLGYSYAMNLLHDNASGDRRSLRLLDALFEVVRHGPLN